MRGPGDTGVSPEGEALGATAQPAKVLPLRATCPRAPRALRAPRRMCTSKPTPTTTTTLPPVVRTAAASRSRHRVADIVAIRTPEALRRCPCRARCAQPTLGGSTCHGHGAARHSAGPGGGTAARRGGRRWTIGTLRPRAEASGWAPTWCELNTRPRLCPCGRRLSACADARRCLLWRRRDPASSTFPGRACCPRAFERYVHVHRTCQGRARTPWASGGLATPQAQQRARLARRTVLPSALSSASSAAPAARGCQSPSCSAPYCQCQNTGLTQSSNV